MSWKWSGIRCVLIAACVIGASTGPSVGTAAAAGTARPIGSFDNGRLDLGTPVAPTYRVDGWSFDPDTTGRPVFADVYDFRPDGSAAGIRVTANTVRNDVAAAYPGVGAQHGWSAAIGLTLAGVHRVCAFAIDTENPDTNTGLGCRTVSVPGPLGSIDTAQMIVQGRLSVEGWAAQPGAPEADTELGVTVTAPNGAVSTYGGIMTETIRADVTTVFPWSNGRTGFGSEIPISQLGRHTVCVNALGSTRATNGGTVPGVNSSLGCRTVDVRNAFGNVDEVTASAGSLRVRGWALNPNATTVPTEVHVYDIGPTATVGRSGLFTSTARPDVVAAFPGLGSQPGFDFNLPTSGAGKHTVCVFAITTGGGIGNVLVNCQDVTVG